MKEKDHHCRKGQLTQRLFTLIAILLSITRCASDDANPEGIRLTPQGSGPMVIFDPLQRPTPEIPFPNDLVTVMDPTSPTGRRLNIRDFAPTGLESKIREHVDKLDGFGTFSPATIAFDKPIDLMTTTAANIKIVNIDPDSPNAGKEAPLDLGQGSFPIEITPWHFPPYDPSIDARQLLFNPAYGDVGSPGFTDFYERETNTIIIRPTIPLDQATEYAVILTEGLKGENGESIRSPFTYVNHTLQTQSLSRALPLFEALGVPLDRIAFAWTFTTQSVTRDLEALAKGIAGNGPFSYLKEEFPPEIIKVDSMETWLDTAFCGGVDYDSNPCRDNVFILQGEMLDTVLKAILGTPQGGELVAWFARVIMGIDLGENLQMAMRLSNIDYLVFGRFRSPDFRSAKDEVFRMDYRTGEAEVRGGEVPFILAIPKPTPGHSQPFPVIVHAHGLPSFRWEVIAMADEWAKHGYASVCMDAVNHSPIVSIQDVEILLNSILGEVEGGLCKSLPEPFCQNMLDGILENLGEPFVDLINCVLFGQCNVQTGTFEEALEALLSTGLMRELLVEGRAIDVDGDGNTDHGYFFTLNLFQSRDRVRQTAVDQMQFLQVLKSLDQSNIPPAVRFPMLATEDELMPNMMAGDFDADGILDLGGEWSYSRKENGSLGSKAGAQRYFRTGFSMGGILNSVLMPVEPEIKTAALVVPGGGLASDILLRIDLRPVSDPLFHELLGPVIVGEPDDISQGEANGSGGQNRTSSSSKLNLSFLIRKKLDTVDLTTGESLVSNTYHVPVGEIQVAEGGSIHIVNEVNGEESDVGVSPGEPFSKGIAADKGDVIRIESRDSSGNTIATVYGSSTATGLGLDRNSADFRRLVTLGQIALEPTDPVNFSPHWFRDPLEGIEPKNILVLSVPGDTMVPVNTQVAAVRASGLFGSQSNVCDGKPSTLEECGANLREDCDCVNMSFISNRVMLGFHQPPEKPRYDIDDLTNCSGIGPLPAIKTQSGYSAVRYPFANQDVNGDNGEIINKGEHWYMAFSDWTIPLNWALYSQNQIAEFFDNEGQSPPFDCSCPAVNDNCRLVPEY